MGARKRNVRTFVCGVIVGVFGFGTARAQTPPSSAGSKSWEIEFFGGFMSGAGPAGGAGQLPAPGAVFAPSIANAPPGAELPSTRLIPTWFFGDGAALFNQTRPPGGLVTRPEIVPLDDMLQHGAVERRRAAVFGARLGRAMTDRVGVEFSVDYTRGKVGFIDAVRPAAEATRNSFRAAFTPVFGSSSSIDTAVTTVEHSGSELTMSGALTLNLARGRSVVPYAVVGAGVAKALGDGPRLDLQGSYQIRQPVTNLQILTQTDAIVVTTHPALGAMFVLGGGLKKDFGARSAVRLDARVRVIGDTTSISARAASSTTPGSPGLFLLVPGSAYAMYFSSFQGAPSSLSVPLDEFETFSGDGTVTQVSVSFGYYVRF